MHESLLTSAGVVTALSDLFRSGGRSLPGYSASILPGTYRSTADDMPPLREGDRYVLGRARIVVRTKRSNYIPAIFPVKAFRSLSLPSRARPASLQSGAYEHS